MGEGGVRDFHDRQLCVNGKYGGSAVPQWGDAVLVHPHALPAPLCVQAVLLPQPPRGRGRRRGRKYGAGHSLICPHPISNSFSRPPPLYVKGHWHTFDFSYVVGAMWHQFELRRGVVPGIETHLVSCWVAIDAGVIRRLILGHAYDLGSWAREAGRFWGLIWMVGGRFALKDEGRRNPFACYTFLLSFATLRFAKTKKSIWHTK